MFIAYRDFWGQFTNPFTNQPVPAFQDKALVRIDSTWRAPEPPYIVYQIVQPPFFDSTQMSADIYNTQPGTVGNFAVVSAIIKQVEALIPEEIGLRLPVGNNGFVRLKRGSPWAITLNDNDDIHTTRGLLNIIVENYTL